MNACIQKANKTGRVESPILHRRREFPLGDVDAKAKEAVKSKLNDLGFYDETPPSWFIQAKNTEAGSDLTPEKLKELWDDYRTKATAASE